MSTRIINPQEVEARFNALPPNLKSLLDKNEVGASVQSIGVKHRLHIDQIGLLESEVELTMLGFIKPEEFSADLVDVLGLDRMTAVSITQDLNENLFLKIRGLMKKASEERPLSSDVTHPLPPPITEKILPKPLAPPMRGEPLEKIEVQKESAVDISSGYSKKPSYRADPYREPAN